MKTLTKLGLALPSIVALALGNACSGSSDTTAPPDGPTTGTIAVSVTTTGEDPDGNGYSVVLDGSEKAAVGVNGSINLNDVAAGTRSVSLSGVAENCAVGGEDPRTVSVTAGVTVQVAFEVSCVAALGSLQASVTTTGDGTDPDGYSLSVDGVQVQTIEVNGSTTLTKIRSGSRSVELGDVAPNCLVTGDNPRTVEVPFGGIAVVSFDLHCDAPLPGKIAFGSQRTGRVEVFIWDGAAGAVTQVTDSPEQGDDSGGYLLSPDGSKVAYVADDGNWDVWTVNTDGSGHVRLTQNSEGFPSRHGAYSWSPDGSRIAFTSPSGVALINADGTGRNTLSDAGGYPVWSPDGSKILFTITEDIGDQRYIDIWRVNPDGTGLEQLTDGGYYIELSYSPDASQVLFASGSYQVVVADPDLFAQVPLAEGRHPKWSPDGSRIAFTNLDAPGTCEEARHVQVMNSDGTEMTAITPSGYCIQDFVWSPDGQWIAFWSYPQSEIYIVPSDGSAAPVNISNHGADDWLGSWGP